MKQLSDIFIDSLEFAYGQRRMQGTAPVSAFPRLADVLADKDGVLVWSVQGERDEERRPFLRIEVTGELHLKCQRCLQALPVTQSIRSRLLLVPPGKPWPDEALEDDSADAIEALVEQPLFPLIEEELLLALPIAPRHERCEPPGYDDGRAAASPFAALAGLKKKH